MFELSDTELQILEELWKLIQTKRTTLGTPSEDDICEMSSTTPQQLADPLIEDRMRVLRHVFTDRT